MKMTSGDKSKRDAGQAKQQEAINFFKQIGLGSEEDRNRFKSFEASESPIPNIEVDFLNNTDVRHE